MHYSSYVRYLALAAALVFAVGESVNSFAQTVPTQSRSESSGNTSVHLRWGQRPGVSRYRLQLARDSEFEDIVFDRVVNGNEHEVNDLAPGRYFWRIAPLTTSLGQFSSAGAIEVSAPARETIALPRATPALSAVTTKAASGSIIAGGGWHAAIGDVNQPVLAHLRSPDRFDIVVTNKAGVTFALDASSGVALWSIAPRNQVSQRITPGLNAPLISPLRSRLDSLIISSGSFLIQVEGATGRELWRANLSAVPLNGAVLNDGSVSEIIVVDNSLQRLFIVSAAEGKILQQIRLSRRAVGAPLIFGDRTGPAMMIALDDGRIEVRDRAGAVIRSGDAGSPATTAPLLIKSTRGDLVLLGTRSGLTAMAAEDLRPLGRVAIDGDAPRGTLLAKDLDGDGTAEVIMLTERGHIVAVNAADGKIVWNVAAGNDSDSIAFADVNGDQVLDVFVSSNQTFANALSGRDGSVIWKDNEPAALAANHANAVAPRAMLAVPDGSGVLFISSEPSRSGLRAIFFPKARIRPNAR